MAAELSLEALRDEIDKIDEVIVRLLDRRARCAYAIGRVKKEPGWPIYEPAARGRGDRAREGGQRQRSAGRSTSDAIVRLYERIMDEARRIQRIEAEARAERDEAGRRTVERTETRVARNVSPR